MPSRSSLQAGLVSAAVIDLVWIAWPWRSLLPVLSFSVSGLNTGSGGIGSVSAGISEGIIESLLVPVPLACHGLAQVCARRAGADVRRWWRRHLLALAVVIGAGLVVAATVMLQSAPHGPTAAWLIFVPLVMLVLVGQHVVLAVVIVKGLRALAYPRMPNDE